MVMHSIYSDFYWKRGVPLGLKKLQDYQTHSDAYKIVTDPYRKRFTIENYRFGIFQKVIYDSQLLDFRKLTMSEQVGWEREILSENSHKVEAIIRNMEERVVLLEKYHFEGGVCRECQIFSLQNNHLATQKMFYETLHDSFNGVLLFDATGRRVLKKVYQVNQEGQFTHLLREEQEINREDRKGREGE